MTRFMTRAALASAFVGAMIGLAPGQADERTTASGGQGAEEREPVVATSEDLAVLSTIVKENMQGLYALGAHESAAGLAMLTDAKKPDDAAVAAGLRFLERSTQMNMIGHAEPSPVGSPLAEYLPGYGVVLQMEIPAPRDDVTDKKATGETKPRMSRWEATQRQLRGQMAEVADNGMRSCLTCHDASMSKNWQRVIDVDGDGELDIVLGGHKAPPTRQQVIDQLVNTLAEQGHNVRHLAGAERITLSVSYKPEAPSWPVELKIRWRVPYGSQSVDPAADPKAKPQKPATGSGDSSPKSKDPASKSKPVNSDRGVSGLFGGGGSLLGSAANEDQENAAASDDATMLRRVYLDLVGTPPTPEEIRAYLADTSTDKRATLIDRLLGSKERVEHFSATWGDLLAKRGQYGEAAAAYERTIRAEIPKLFESKDPKALLTKPEHDLLVRKYIQSIHKLGETRRASDISQHVYGHPTTADGQPSQPPPLGVLHVFGQATTADGKVAAGDRLMLDAWINARLKGADPVVGLLNEKTQAASLPVRISVSATKAQLDEAASGKLSRDEFARRVSIRISDPTASVGKK